MGTEKRQRQKEGRQARIAAAEAAQRKAATRQRIISFVGLAVVIVALIAAITYFTNKKSDNSTVASTDTSVSSLDTSSSAPASTLASAAGLPCVALADPLPTGAPNVPVVVGPPPTELVKQDLTGGTGAEVTAGDTITVNYIGVACSTGKIFDSSYSRGQPATFSLAQVIPGWTQGIPGMKVGGSRLLGIPSDLAYGSQGAAQGGIAPDEALWFVVDVTAITPATTTTSAAGASTTTSAVAP